MVKISFGLLKPKKVEKDDININNKLSSVFSKPEDSSKENVKKQLITELSFTNNSSEDKEEELNKYVIPCKNSLKNLKDENVSYTPPKKVTEELKYGLNIIYESKDKKLEEKVDESDDNKLTVLDDNSKTKGSESNKRPLDDTSRCNESRTKDDEVAKEIIEELERKKLREQLFGTQVELIDRISRTTPILLRGKKNRVDLDSIVDNLDSSLDRADTSTTALKVDSKKDGKDNKKDENNDGKDKSDKSNKDKKNKNVDIKTLLDVKMDQYENVPVENFGLAMLLGMGYDPKKNNIEPKVYKKRVFERAGLGADSVMKTNMESLMDANLMSKLKKNHLYNIVDGNTTVSNWALPGIVVKISDKNHENYKQKGVVKSVDKNMVNLIIQGKELQINFKHLETVVSMESRLCKVVRRIPNNKKKDYIQVGSLVKVVSIDEEHARIIFEDQELVVSLDSISQVQN